MKKITALLLALVLAVSVLTVSVSARKPSEEVANKVDLFPHNHPSRHKELMVWDYPENCVTHPIDMSIQMTTDQMEKYMAKIDPKLVPEDCDIRPGHITKVECRSIEFDGEGPFEVTFRVWGTIKKPVMVFFREDPKDDWEFLDCNLGQDITVDFPASGYYAVGKVW